MNAPLYTVFTPTFNRAHTLKRVYNSLCCQTFLDFEWLIVDDGSTDDTRALVEQWKHEAAFPVGYVFQRNQGKLVAFNHGVRLAKGELFFPLDSDDEILPDALAKLTAAWLSCPDPDRATFSGVTGLCLDRRGNIIGSVFPRSPLDSNTSEVVYRFRIKGEKQGFIRTSVLREFPFPEIDGVKFIPESIVWTRIGRRYITRYINEAVRIYHGDSGNQITTRAASTHARGQAIWHCSVLNEQVEYFSYAPGEFLRSAVHYVRFSLHAGQSREIWRRLGNPLAKLLVVIAVPLALAVYFADRTRTGADPNANK